MISPKYKLTLIILSGASRGIGKGLSLEFAKRNSNFGDLHFLLTSTKIDDLKKCSSEILSKYPDVKSVDYEAFDMSDMNNLLVNMENLFSKTKLFLYDRIIVISNHGTLGKLSLISDLSSEIKHVSKSLDINITSVYAFVSAALNKFKNRCNVIDFVNISSLAASQPFKGWSIYCCGKAARDMIHNVIACEAPLISKTLIRSLNYAPGVIDTDMQREVRAKNNVEEMKILFEKMFVEGKLISVKTTAAKLIDILVKEEWKSGDHIDYYEI